jgi:hypothetical protein
MKKITKILLGLVASISMSMSAFAGDLSLTGTAIASYVIGGADDSNRKGIGISNEFTMGATGEMDNGFTWAYHIDFDPNAGGTVDQDDAGLVIGMGDMGTIGIYVSEGGLSKEYGWGIGALGTGSDWAGVSTQIKGYDVSNNENVQYHLPSGLLPFGIGAKVAYAPETTEADSQDKKSDGSIVAVSKDGENATHYQITAAPLDGLALGADYYQTGNATGAYQDKESGNVYAKYTMGNFSAGIGHTKVAPGIAAASKYAVTNHYLYEGDSYGIQFDVNDALSVSYSQETSERKTYGAPGTSVGTGKRTANKSEEDHIQVAYTMGGATFGLAVVEADNSDYVSGKEEKKTVFTMALAF